jgi:hypothetical protein
MVDADTSTTEAARALSRARWGTTVVDKAVALLEERRDDLGPVQQARVAALLEPTTPTDERTDDE